MLSLGKKKKEEEKGREKSRSQGWFLECQILDMWFNFPFVIANFCCRKAIVMWTLLCVCACESTNYFSLSW